MYKLPFHLKLQIKIKLFTSSLYFFLSPFNLFNFSAEGRKAHWALLTGFVLVSNEDFPENLVSDEESPDFLVSNEDFPDYLVSDEESPDNLAQVSSHHKITGIGTGILDPCLNKLF